jgi:hypothetical protein
VTAAQRELVRRMQGRALVRAWEYRQRDHAKGAWFRLRRVLVDAARAFAISEVDADRLEAQGLRPVSIGRELSPEKRIYFGTWAQIEQLEASELEVRLSAELLQSTAIVLLAHEIAPAVAGQPEPRRVDGG